MRALKSCVGCGRLSQGRWCPTCRPRRAPEAKANTWRPERGTAAWRAMRAKVWARDCGVCARCGQEVPDGQRWDLGHVVAFADGGEFVADNLRVEHVRCNRGARDG